jgi:hypothetical protein
VGVGESLSDERMLHPAPPQGGQLLMSRRIRGEESQENESPTVVSPDPGALTGENCPIKLGVRCDFFATIKAMEFAFRRTTLVPVLIIPNP